MIEELWLRWIVTVLFVVSAVECAVAVAVNRHRFVSAVSHGLHLAMAVAMAVMAWPAGAALPTTAPMLFFLAAAVWFLVLTLAERGHRLINGYHVFMMLAMAWMYAVMSGALQPVAVAGAGHGSGHGSHHGGGMPAMPMESGAAPTPPFVTGLNWIITVCFAVATLWWVYRLLTARKSGHDGSALQTFGLACQAMMAAGMTIMFAVML